MHNILIFAAIFVGMALTVLFGPQWGIMMGLMTYLAGSSTLHSRELVQLKQEFQRRMSEIPELVSELVEQKLKLLRPSIAPSDLPAPTDRPAHSPEAAPAALQNTVLDDRFSALDNKLSTLVELMLAREASAPAPEPVRSAPRETAAAPPPPPLSTKRQVEARGAAKPRPMPSSAYAPRRPTEGEEMDLLDQEHDAELASMRELIEKMAVMLASQGVIQDGAIKDSSLRHPGASPGASGTQRQSYQHLREELDKIAYEVRSELGRPNP